MCLLLFAAYLLGVLLLVSEVDEEWAESHMWQALGLVLLWPVGVPVYLWRRYVG